MIAVRPQRGLGAFCGWLGGFFRCHASCKLFSFNDILYPALPAIYHDKLYRFFCLHTRPILSY
jgi:hypothetical protein